MSEELFMVQTTNGVRSHDGSMKGLTREQASATAADANERAKAYGLTARYEIAPFVKMDKDGQPVAA